MLMKRYKNDVGNGEGVPNTDEGWWASVLADEEGYASAQKENGTKPGGQSSLASVDWERVRDIYEQDEIVSLKVQGYNRGGLLVEGDGLQGFVPVSHLVEMPNGISEE